MRRYTVGFHTKTALKVHVVWIPKYRKRVLTGQVAIRARDMLRQIAMEHELDIITAGSPKFGGKSQIALSSVYE
jgi:putative transposase